MNFNKYKISKVGSVITGKTPPTKNEEYFSVEKDKYLFITPRDMNINSKYISETERYLTDFVTDKFSSLIIDNKSICVSCIGTVGKVFIPKQLSITNQQINSITNLKDFCNFDYLYYYLKQNYKKIQSVAGGTTMPIVNKSSFEGIEIELPSLSDQLKIVKILNKIDEKIELNNEINNNLYEMGDNLYNEYFGKYKDNLPSDYKIVKLNEVADNYDSKRKPISSREREQHRGIYPYYGATSIIDHVDNYIFDDTYLLMGEDGTVKTDDGFPVLQYIWGKNWINNHAHVLKGKNISTELLMFALRKINIENIITGAVQPKINQENMNKIEFVIGSNSKNKELEVILKNLMDKSKNIIEENRRLEQLRDTLLPKLMNGEIDLDNIEI